jgi:transmembrane sensor
MDNRSSNEHHEVVMQAAEFFVLFRAGDAPPIVRTRFQQWLRASPEHIRAYLECAASWSKLPTADPEGRIDLQSVLAAAHEAEDENVISLKVGRTDVPRPCTTRRVRVLALVGLFALLLVVLSGTWFWAITQEGLTYKTGVGEQRTLILADGSTVTLSALTTVRVYMSKEAREVTLVCGQAYFHDADEPNRPFIVRAGKSSVRAIGTKFDVDEESDGLTVVTVLEGRVAVGKSLASIDSIERRELTRELLEPSHKSPAVLVAAGEQVTILAQNVVPAPSPVDVTAVTAWMQQRLVFDHTPLSKVAEQFNRYSKRRLVIADPSLRNVTVSGEYSAVDPDTLIKFLRSQPTLYVREQDDAFVVTRP